MNKAHTGLWIPLAILFNEELSAAERILVAEIKALDAGQGCFAGNDHLGRVVGVKPRRVRQMLASLKERGILRIENATSVRRRIYVDSLAETSGAAPGLEALPQAAKELEGGQSSADCSETLLDSATLPGNARPSDPAKTGTSERQNSATENTVRQQVEKTSKTPHIELPVLLPSSSWQDWIDHNNEIGRNLTLRELQAQLRVLEGLHLEGFSVSEVIDQSIANRYKSFFEVRGRKRSPPRQRLDGTKIMNRGRV